MLEMEDLEDFLCQGGDIHQRNEKGETLVQAATRNMDADALSILLDAGARARVVDSARQTPLHWAVFWNQPRLIDRLLLAGASVDAQDNEGLTPLMRLVQNGGWTSTSQTKKARLSSNLNHLLSYPCNLNLADVQGWTALHHAASIGNLEGASALIHQGASPVLWDLTNALPQDLCQKNHPHLMAQWLAIEEQHRFAKLPQALASDAQPRL